MESLGFTEPFLAARPARYVEEDEHFDITSIRCGILFFMAFWSGPARQAYGELKRFLAELDPGGQVELIVIDVDGCTKLCKLPEFGVRTIRGGYGETAWVHNGRIVSTTGQRFHPECFMDNTRALLQKQ